MPMDWVENLASGNRMNQTDKPLKIDKLRAPWVPAPGKSSSANVTAQLEICSDLTANKAYAIMNSSSSSTGDAAVVNQSQLLPKYKKSTMTSLNKVQSSKSMKDLKSANKLQSSSTNHHVHKQRQTMFHRNVRKPSSQFKKVKNTQQRTGMQYRLQSKDSLVDVTACLQEKREEVMKLWEKSLFKNDPSLHTNIENANRLALEASEEVEKLRRTIQEFHKKDDGLSEADCIGLEQMRIAVLKKVKEFEEADNMLQENISRQSVSKTSLASAMSKTSQTESVPFQAENSKGILSHTQPSVANQSLSNQDVSHYPNEQDMIVLKETATNFSEESECDTFNIIPFVENNVTLQSKSLEDFTGNSVLPTIENLHMLRSLYEESMNLAPVHEIIKISTQGAIGAANASATNVKTFAQNIESNSRQRPKHHPNQRVRFTEAERKPEDRGESNFSGENDLSTSDDMYREKISVLQRQLMNTEYEVEELKAEVERIESDANYRVRILQNNVQDKFDSLQAIPDYLEMVDQKLRGMVQEKLNLQHELENKNILIKDLKEQNEYLGKKATSLQDQLRKAENSKDFVSFKNADLEKTNEELKKQVEELTNQVGQMTFEIKNLKDSDHKATSSHAKNDFKKENQKLKLHCVELKEEINQARRLMQTLRKSKTKLVTSLTERIEELMDALQAAQQHKRILGEQIRCLKKSYHELFPVEVFKQVPLKKPIHVSRSSYKKKTTKGEGKPVDEPKVESTVAWQTGSGIKIDDLLQVNIS